MSGEHGSAYSPELSERELADAAKRADEMRELVTSRTDPRQLEENIANIFSAVELGIIPWDIAIRVLHGLSTVSFDET